MDVYEEEEVVVEEEKVSIEEIAVEEEIIEEEIDEAEETILDCNGNIKEIQEIVEKFKKVRPGLKLGDADMQTYASDTMKKENFSIENYDYFLTRDTSPENIIDEFINDRYGMSIIKDPLYTRFCPSKRDNRWIFIFSPMSPLFNPTYHLNFFRRRAGLNYIKITKESMIEAEEAIQTNLEDLPKMTIMIDSKYEFGCEKELFRQAVESRNRQFFLHPDIHELGMACKVMDDTNQWMFIFHIKKDLSKRMSDIKEAMKAEKNLEFDQTLISTTEIKLDAIGSNHGFEIMNCDYYLTKPCGSNAKKAVDDLKNDVYGNKIFNSTAYEGFCAFYMENRWLFLFYPVDPSFEPDYIINIFRRIHGVDYLRKDEGLIKEIYSDQNLSVTVENNVSIRTAVNKLYLQSSKPSIFTQKENGAFYLESKEEEGNTKYTLFASFGNKKL